MSDEQPILEFPIKIRAQSLHLLTLTSRSLKIKKYLEELEMLEMESITSLKGVDGKNLFTNEQARKAAMFKILSSSRKYLEMISDFEDIECLVKKANIELQYLRDMYTAYIAVGRVV